MKNDSQDTVSFLMDVVQDALESNLDSKSNVKDKDKDRKLWDAMHWLQDQDDESE